MQTASDQAMRSQSPLSRSRALVLALAGGLFATSAEASGTVKLPAEFRIAPWSTRTLSVGSPHDGYLVRGARLRATPALRLWNAKDVPSFSTPHLLKALASAAAQVRAEHPGAVVLVHALSSEKGGAIRGKRSHQNGRDADLVLFSRDVEGRPASPRKLPRFGADGRSTKGEGLVLDDARNWTLVERLAKDPAVTHIFIAPAQRTLLLDHARRAKVPELRMAVVAAKLFADVGDEPLDAVLHVRVDCPKGQEAICLDAAR